MEIRIVTVGKIKEKYLCDGIAEYAKRLSRYCRLTFCQVADEKTPDKASEALNTQIKNYRRRTSDETYTRTGLCYRTGN